MGLSNYKQVPTATIEKVKKHPAYDEGFKSYRSTDSIPKNPYPLNTREYYAYQDGWIQALKKSPRLSFDSRYQLPVKQPMPSKTDKQQFKKESREYRKATGN